MAAADYELKEVDSGLADGLAAELVRVFWLGLGPTFACLQFGYFLLNRLQWISYVLSLYLE